MRSGRKPLSHDEKRNRATYRPDRVGAGLSAPEALCGIPTQPDWLTPAGLEAWLDNLPRVVRTRRATDLDSEMFGNFCNLLGGLTMAWRVNQVPPISALTEMRRLAELFGLCGPGSRAG